MTTLSLRRLGLSVLICEAVGLTSGLLSMDGMESWFHSLTKPSWNPPSYLFGPVWGILYLMMGISLFLVWNSKAYMSHRRDAILVFGIQLFLNFWWSIFFFRLQSPGWAFVNIILLVLAILATIYKFSTISTKAAWQLLPYLAWVCFASILNYALWVLN